MRKILARLILIFLCLLIFVEVSMFLFFSINYNYYSKLDNFPEVKRETWYTQNKKIIHATGGIDGLTYTNSKEALENTIHNGGKVVEIDFDYTTDGYLVCYHKPNDISKYMKQDFTLNEFLNTKIKGKYTPMTIENVIEIMEQNPELYVSIDTKHEEITEVVEDIVGICENKGVLNRFIVQCFYPGEKSKVAKIYNFPEDNYIFAAYKYSKNPFKVLKVCYEENYNVVATKNGNWDSKILKLFDSKNIYVYLHTINNPEVMAEVFNAGTYGIYTDFIFD